MDLQSPHPVSAIRRNPPRKAKRTVSKNDQISLKPSNDITGIPPFTTDEIIEPEPPQISEVGISNSLKVFLRICPIDCRATQGQNIAGGEARAKGRGRLAKEVDAKNMPCLFVNSSSSVTLTAPPSAQGSNRSKNEVYDGFSHVFSSESSQEDIYNKIMQPLVMDFIGGHSSLLVAMGPTGSGKTYTMFGSPQQLGIVHLALRQIFSHKAENENIQVSRVYFLSMFEIHSERGKGEKIFDLFPDIIPHQQASISSFKEVKITTVDDAAKIVAHGISKRSTALTNANNQSSRSQCIINVRCVQKSDADNHSLSNAVLTIADLAGAERERKTGNQGSRLMESNFINNTSMVFGQCLRSLLEHQKNLKKPIEKHFKNSLLTRYLQDYMEGRKRMTLILTVKAAQEDYMDTSFILRQASPYMKIKFNHLHLYNNAPCQKRKDQLAKTERSKRQKASISEVSLIDGNLAQTDAAIKTTLSEKDSFEEGFGKQVDTALHDALLLKIKGEENMRNFARALLSTLEQYKLKLTESENEVQHLKESLKKQSAHFTDMENKLVELSRNPCSCSSNSFVKECIPYHKLDTVVLPNANGTPVAEIPAEGYSSLTMEGNSMDSSYQHPGRNSKSLQKNAQSDNEVGDMGCSLHILGNEEISMMQAEKSPETSGKNETDHDANMVDASLLDTITEVDRCALPLPVNRMALQQAEIPAEDYSSLPLKENFIELSCQRSGGNSKSLQKDAQSDVDVGDMGCCLHILGNEEILVMQAEKKIMAENVTLTDNVQQTAPSHSTEALKCKEDDPALKPLNSQRPRRKLLPASTILLKEFNGLFMDENATEEVKRKRTANTEGRSDGNVSLIQIFKSNLQR